MKTVLITGGSRGIGKACVELFKKEGYNVAFTYKNSENESKMLAERIGALAIKADSQKEEEVVSAVKKTVDAYGHIDCLINNAGVSSFSFFTDITINEWNRIIGTNLTGAFLYSREVARQMISRKYGKIINITSMWGLVGSSCEVHYSASKAGLIGLTKALAKELGPSGICVNAIAPGVINTEMNKALDKESMYMLRDETPLMRIGEAMEVAESALFLASDKANFITGEVINVSGGFVIT